MEEEKREGQKTVVAFISGLLIGGLLMWVFGAQPKKDAPADVKADDTTAVETNIDATPTATPEVTTNTTKPAEVTTTKPEVVAGVGSLTVSNRSESTRLNSSHVVTSRMPSSA